MSLKFILQSSGLGLLPLDFVPFRNKGANSDCVVMFAGHFGKIGMREKQLVKVLNGKKVCFLK